MLHLDNFHNPNGPNNPNALFISFIGNNDLMVVQKADNSVIVARQSIRHIEQMPISSPRPSGNAIRGPATPSYKAAEITLEPGEKTGPFMDYHQRKYWIVLSGVAKLTVGKDTLRLERHQAQLIPIMTEHRIENVGNTELVFVEFRCKEPLTGQEVIRFTQGVVATRVRT
ncbi:MAG: cupin domain-containing protein [Psychrosphaera sp.]|nr:cupin domain-containing protein [Psychrosphaera sp.]